MFPAVVGATTRAQRRLQNRVDLWHGYAQRTANLRARYQLTRHTSIMQHPLVATGTLVFIAPEQLVFYDDSEAGSRTEIHGQQMWMTPRSGEPTGAPREPTDAARWLRDRFRRLFAPTTPEDFLADASISIPRGTGMRLTFLPPEGSPVRRELRTLQVRFDPVSGAVIHISFEEARGDRVILVLSDHRQNVDPSTLSEFIAPSEAT